MPRGISVERMEANAAALRDLVNSGSPRVVRDAVVGSAFSGARRRNTIPDIGHSSGKLTVTGYISGVRKGISALIVKCACGFPEYTVDIHNYRNLKSSRCNICAKKAASKKRYWLYSAALPDDEHRTRLLNRLAAAITRCHSKTNRMYKHYGERGIKVHDEWRKDRAAFLKYVQTLTDWDVPEFEMDRIDVNGNYEPGNIRFVSRSDNLRNKRRVEDLEAEVACLRSCLLRAEEQIRSLIKSRTANSS